MALNPTLFVSPKPDPNPDPTLLQPSSWNRMVGLLNGIFDGPDTLGAILARDPGDATDGGTWIPSAVGVLTCGAAGALPLFRALTASDVPPLPYVPTTGAASLTLTDHLSIGTNPAQSGAIRLANNQFLSWRTAANGADIYGLYLNGSDNLVLGQGAGYVVCSSGNFVPGSDNSLSLGGVGLTWANVYVGSSVVNKVKAGTPTDADVVSPANGMLLLDSTANKIWVRLNGAWKGVAVT